MATASDPKEAPSSTFPLHRLVWGNKYQELDGLLQGAECDKEELDPRGRSGSTYIVLVYLYYVLFMYSICTICRYCSRKSTQ